MNKRSNLFGLVVSDKDFFITLTNVSNIIKTLWCKFAYFCKLDHFRVTEKNAFKHETGYLKNI
jgi:hypothetical protein